MVAVALAAEGLQVFVGDGRGHVDLVVQPLLVEGFKVHVGKGAQEIPLPKLQHFHCHIPPVARVGQSAFFPLL